jgi:hypothetical protein
VMAPGNGNGTILRLKMAVVHRNPGKCTTVLVAFVEDV